MCFNEIVKRMDVISFASVSIKKKGMVRKMKYVCDVCGWIYDEEMGDADLGVEAGTKFEDLPEDFLCPLCMVGKDQFSLMVD